MNTSRYGATGAPYRLVHVRGRRDYARSMAAVTCDFCGRRADEAAALTWTTSVERGRRRTYCDDCSRTHVRAIEGKLDQEWW